MDLSHDSPDPRLELEAEQLILRIVAYKSTRQESFGFHFDGSVKPESFSVKVDNLQEYFYDVSALLAKNAVDLHQYLWLVNLRDLAVFLYRFESYFDDQLFIDFSADQTLLGHIGVKLTKLSADILELVSVFFSNINVGLFVDEDLKISVFLHELIKVSLETVTLDKSDEILYCQAASEILNRIKDTLLACFEIVADDRDSHYAFFPVLTQFIRVIYVSGHSNLLVPFIDRKLIDPHMGITIVKNSTVGLLDLINYYKFTAFNLLSLSQSSNQNLNQEADTYFKVLFNFPNLSIDIYESFQFETVTDRKPAFDFLHKEKELELMVSVAERQEISLLFVFNYLLKLTDLRQLLDPEYYYRVELKFLLRSLSASLSKEIDRSASRSSSTHSSMVSIAHMAEVEQNRLQAINRAKLINKLKLNSLSVILLGSYKEKLNLVIHFCELLKHDSLNIGKINTSFSSILLEQDKNLSLAGQYSFGKELYLSTVGKITKILTVLATKFLFVSGGLNNVLLQHLAKIFNVSKQYLEELYLGEISTSLLDGINFKRKDNEIILVLRKSPESEQIDLSESVRKQLDIYKLTADLNKVSDMIG